jgi:hypothetical protein
MPQIWFEPTVPVFERAKTVHALNRAATVIGYEHTSASGITSIAPTFLTSALDDGEWSGSRPGRFNRGKEPPVHMG